LEVFAPLLTPARIRSPSVIDLRTGRTQEPFKENGYRSIPAFLKWHSMEPRFPASFMASNRNFIIDHAPHIGFACRPRFLSVVSPRLMSRSFDPFATNPPRPALTLVISLHGLGKNGPTLWVYGRRNDGLRSRRCDWRPQVTRSSVIGLREQEPVRRISLSGGRYAANDRAPSFPGGGVLCRIHSIRQNATAPWQRNTVVCESQQPSAPIAVHIMVS